MTLCSWAAWTARASFSTSSAASLGNSGAAGQLLVEAAAGTELQREEGTTLMLSDFVDLHNVGMLQAADRLRLGAEPRQVVGSGVGAGQDHLERDEAIESDLAGLVDDAHAAPAQLAQDFITGNLNDGPGRRGGALTRRFEVVRTGGQRAGVRTAGRRRGGLGHVGGGR